MKGIEGRTEKATKKKKKAGHLFLFCVLFFSSLFLTITMKQKMNFSAKEDKQAELHR